MSGLRGLPLLRGRWGAEPLWRRICVVVCIGLALLAGSMWLKSLGRCSLRGVVISGRQYFAGIAPHQLLVGDARPDSQTVTDEPSDLWANDVGDLVALSDYSVQIAGFLVIKIRSTRADQYPRLVLGIPFWAIIASLMAFPVLALTRAMRRQHWIVTGRCSTCGYDLRASPGPRCSECGGLIRRA